jgi:hypothetical protein
MKKKATPAMRTTKKKISSRAVLRFASLRVFPRGSLSWFGSFCLLLALLLLAGGIWSGKPAFAAPNPQQKPSYTDCILYGNVFTADGHLFEGADVHVRRATDKKPKWEAYSDRRGEFAVRVPPGPQYVIEVKAKGFVTQTQTVTSETSARLDLVFHMEPQPDKGKSK